MNGLAHLQEQVPNKQATTIPTHTLLFDTKFRVLNACFFERVIDADLSIPAGRRVDHSGLWTLESRRELPRTADNTSSISAALGARAKSPPQMTTDVNTYQLRGN